MSRTNLRYGGVALVGAVAIGSLVHPAAATTTSATLKSERATPVADAVASLPQPGQAAVVPQQQKLTAAPVPQQQKLPAAVAPAAIVPALSNLTIPTMSAAASSQGFAQRDLLVDAAPDLVGRDLQFVLQRQDGQTWVDAASGTTTTDTDIATVPNLPAGTYRVVLPAQSGMEQFVGQPFTHQPRQLGAGISFAPGDVRTVVDVNPDPDAGGSYSFALQKQASGGWQPVGEFTTGGAGGTYAFQDLASGTYRVVVPDQANALGTVSNEVTVTSAADALAAAQAQAAQAQAQERAAKAQRAAAAVRSNPTQQRLPRQPTYSRVAPTPPPPPPPPPPPAGGSVIVATALAQVGDPYRLGATGPNAFDCSGLTSFAYRAAGLSIPRTAAAQYASARKVSDPQPGDLVFFLKGAQHVGIYLGNGKIVHAANPRRGVEVTSINSGWYARTFTGYGRY